MPAWAKALLVLLVVWLVAAVIIGLARSQRPSGEALVAYIETHPLTDLEGAEREKVIANVVRQLNRLDFEERRILREGGADRRLFEQMNDEERREFLEATLPEGFRQLMLALNKMEAQERQRIVRRALEDLERDNPEMAGRWDDENARKLLSQGLDSFYEEASAEVKLDFAPVIERIQRATQNLR